MTKTLLKRAGRALGLNLVSADRFGVDLELDLARLTAHEPLRTIFDVGGNFGQTATRLSAAFPDATVFTFEPVPASFLRLQEAVRKQANIKAVNTAVGDRTGVVEIDISGAAGSNSILSSRSSSVNISVPIDTVDSLAKANGLESIDLLKIDVEGYELSVIRGAESLIGAGKIRYIFAECVLPTDPEFPHTSFFDLDAVLRAMGFCFVSYYAESFALTNGVALGNVLYALKARLPVSVPGKVRNIV